MAGALDGTIKTPLGPVQKKTALLLGGGVIVIGVIIWYRQKQLGDTEVTLPEGEINPATGYAYGSAEDAAALAALTGYVSPPATPAPGGSGGYPSNLGFASNGQWVQAVVEYMVGNDLIEEPSQLSSALGKYITGAYVTDVDVSLIQQAIASQGFPPVASPNGYPPSLNRTNPSPAPTPTPTPTPTPLKAGVGWDWVRKGDTLAKIAARWPGVTVSSLRQLNSPGSLNRLTVGEAIRVRGKAGPKPG